MSLLWKTLSTQVWQKVKRIAFNKYKFSNHDKNNFTWLLQRSVYPYEYMDDWEELNEISLPEKEDFYNFIVT